MARLLNILRALEQNHRGLTVQELIRTADLGCTERTVYRDLDHLRTAGFPLVEEDHRVRVDGKALTKEPWQPSQMLALLVVEDILQPLAGHEIVGAFGGLRTSVRSRLTPQGQTWVDTLRATVTVTAVQTPLYGSAEEVLETIGDAVVNKRCVRLDYAASGRAVSVCEMEPHLVWTHEGRAYLIAYCREAQQFRTLAVQRIRRAEVLEDGFERRPNFDSAEYVRRGFAELEGPKREVTIHFAREIAHLARERVWHPSQRVIERPDGTCDLRMRTGGVPDVAAWIASSGGKLRAIRPPELVAAVRELLQAGLMIHDEAAAGADAPPAKAPLRRKRAGKSGPEVPARSAVRKNE